MRAGSRLGAESDWAIAGGSVFGTDEAREMTGGSRLDNDEERVTERVRTGRGARASEEEEEEEEQDEDDDEQEERSLFSEGSDRAVVGAELEAALIADDEADIWDETAGKIDVGGNVV